MSLYRFEGRAPQIDSEAWIAPSADLIGDVVIGARTTILFGAVIRADNSRIAIGAESNVQDLSALHSDDDAPLTIGNRVTIGHKAILHGCTIEDEVLIGMGAKILNRAVIARGSLVGANALVTEGKSFPPGSLIIGSPAKAVRLLTEAEREAIRASAVAYVVKGAAFAASLAPITDSSI